MAKLGTNLAKIILPIVWLAVVGVAIFLAIKRYEHSIHLYIVIGIAIGMLVLFALNYAPRKFRQRPFAELVAHLFVGFLILMAILALAVSLVKGYKRFGLLGNAALMLFLITFVTIFVDYVKDFKKNSDKRK